MNKPLPPEAVDARIADATPPVRRRRRTGAKGTLAKSTRTKATPGKQNDQRGKRVSTWSDAIQTPDQQYELKRRALIHAAARAFNARGYHNTSLDDVAAELGVTRAALYHYIRSKQEILFECHMLTYDLGEQAIEHARAHAKDGLETGCLLIRRFIELFNGSMGRVAVMSEHESLEPTMQALVQKRRDDFDHEFRSIIESGIRDGSIRAVDAKLAVFFAMGAVNWMGTRWYRPDGPLSIEQIAASFEDMFRAAMSA